MGYRSLLIVCLFLPLLVMAKEDALPSQDGNPSPNNEVFGNISHEDYTCLKKAEFGQHLAVKKIKGVPLAEILQKIEYARQSLKRHTGQIIPPATFVEMKSMAKEAYSHTYESDVDVQSYVEHLYRTCLGSHI